MKTKRNVSLMLVFLLCVSMLQPTAAEAKKKITISKKSLSIVVGKTCKLKIKGTKKKVKWSSSKKSVASVSSKGLVKARKTGKATITAKVSGKKYKCKVTVKAKNSGSNAGQPEPTVTNKPDDDQQPTVGAEEKKNTNDVAVITKLIREQKALGANVSENLDAEEYYWETVPGDDTGFRLVSIDWSDKALQGEISFAGLTALAYLYCSENQLTGLDVSKNTALMSLYCGGNQLTSLDVSKNTALEFLSCFENQLTSLDVSSNTLLASLLYDDIEIIGKENTKLDN